MRSSRQLQRCAYHADPRKRRICSSLKLKTKLPTVSTVKIGPYAWFPPFRFRSAVAVSPLPLRKFRKNSVSAVACVKNSVAPLPFQLPLRRNRRSVANRIESYFCRSAV